MSADQLRIPSQSNPKKFYIATWLPGPQRWTCTCPAHMYSRDGTCKHVKDLPPPKHQVNQPIKNIGRRAISARVANLAKEIEARITKARAEAYEALAKEHNPPNKSVRKSNPQKGCKRVRGPDGKFYMTPRESTGPYTFVPGKKGRIGTKVKI